MGNELLEERRCRATTTGLRIPAPTSKRGYASTHMQCTHNQLLLTLSLMEWALGMMAIDQRHYLMHMHGLCIAQQDPE